MILGITELENLFEESWKIKVIFMKDQNVFFEKN